MTGGGSRYSSRNKGTGQNITGLTSEKTDEKFSQTEITNFFVNTLKEINEHNYDAINQHKDTITDKLKSEFNIDDIRFGGSHSTSTDVKNLSDIDMLAEISDYFSPNNSSDQVIKEFADAIRERLPNTTISSGVMAVTVEFSDGLTVQILPAFRNRDGYRIPNPDGGGWIETFPKRFAKALTQLNQKHSEKIVPIVKLVKSICSKANIGVSSYHVSNIVLNAFRDYTGSNTYQEMLQHFFNKAKSLCLQPTRDPSGQTKYVDDNITKSKRSEIARDFSNLEEKVNEAIKSPSLEKWKELFKK